MNPSVHERHNDAGDARAGVLADVCGAVLGMLAELRRSPGRIRASVNDVVLELEWPEEGAPAGSVGGAVPGSIPVPAPEPENGAGPAGHVLTASTVGTFYRAPEPGATPFVEIGDTVRSGQQVAILEAMKLMIPVESDIDGVVTEVLVENGTSVEFGTPLLCIERS